MPDSPTHPPVRVFAIVPAAGRSRRMGRAKQLLPVEGRTMLESVVAPLLAASLDGVLIVTHAALAAQLRAAGADFAELARASIALNDDPASAMIDSIRIGLHWWGGRLTIDDCRLTTDDFNPQSFITGAMDGGHDVDGSIPNPQSTIRNRQSTIVNPQSSIPNPQSPIPNPQSSIVHRPSSIDMGFLISPADQPGLTPRHIDLCAAAFRRDPTRIVIAAHAGRRGHPMIFPASLAPFVHSPACDGGLRQLPRARADLVTLVELDTPAVTRNVNTPEDYDSL